MFVVIGGLVILLVSYFIKGFCVIKCFLVKDKMLLLFVFMGGVFDIKFGGLVIYVNKKIWYICVGGVNEVKYFYMLIVKNMVIYVMIVVSVFVLLVMLVMVVV